MTRVMTLKLLAPVRVDGLQVRAAAAMERPAAYARAWDAAAEAAGDRLAAVPGVRGHEDGGEDRPADRSGVQVVRFTHGSAWTRSAGSRYRAIDRDSMVRPMHLLEIEWRPSAEDLGIALETAAAAGRRELTGPMAAAAAAATATPSTAVSRTSAAAAVAGAGVGEPHAADVEPADAAAIEAVSTRLAAAPTTCLLRIFDHGIGVLELDVPIPSAHLAGSEATGAVEARLDALQHLGIHLAERLAEQLHAAVVDPLLAWLRGREADVGAFLHPSPATSDEAAGRGTPAMWVTRTLVLHASGAAIAGEESAAGLDDATRRRVVEHWIKDVTDDERGRCDWHGDRAAVSTSWLNYVFAEESHPGPYPSRGWAVAPGGDGRVAVAEPFCMPWRAVVVAQARYAAFDRLLGKLSRILAVSVAGERRRRIRTVKAELDAAIRDARTLAMDVDEQAKYQSPRVAARVDAMLAGWRFEERLRRRVDELIDDCTERLSDLHGRALEQSSVYTDLILLAIGITAVFEVFLTLSEYGRTMSADPDLSVYDRTSWLNVAAWVGGSSTDVILFASAVLSLGLVLLYAWFRAVRSRI